MGHLSWHTLFIMALFHFDTQCIEVHSINQFHIFKKSSSAPNKSAYIINSSHCFCWFVWFNDSKLWKSGGATRKNSLFLNSHDSISSIFLVWNVKICMSSLLNSWWWDSNGSLAQVNFLLIKWKNCFIVSSFCWLCRSWNVSQISLQSLKELVKINLIAEKEIGGGASQLGETFNQGRHWPFAIFIHMARVSIYWII